MDKEQIKKRLEELISKQQEILKDVKPEKSGFRVFPGTPEELQPIAQEYIKLQEALGNKMPRKTWQKDLGAIIAPDGSFARISGGLASSKNPLTFQSTASSGRRAVNEAIQSFGETWRPPPQLLDALGKVVPQEDVHKHHVLLLKIIEPWTLLPNGQPRPAKQLRAIIEALHAKDWWSGNVNKNFMYMPQAGHLDEDLAVHNIFQGVTDLQGRAVSEADEIIYKLQDGSEVTLPAKDTAPKGSKKTGYKFGGRTYDIGSKHGFSREFTQAIAKINDPKKISELLIEYLDGSGAGEWLRGGATIAYETYGQPSVIKDGDVVTGDLMGDRLAASEKYQAAKLAVEEELTKPGTDYRTKTTKPLTKQEKLFRERIIAVLGPEQGQEVIDSPILRRLWTKTTDTVSDTFNRAKGPLKVAALTTGGAVVHGLMTPQVKAREQEYEEDPTWINFIQKHATNLEQKVEDAQSAAGLAGKTIGKSSEIASWGLMFTDLGLEVVEDPTEAYNLAKTAGEFLTKKETYTETLPEASRWAWRNRERLAKEVGVGAFNMGKEAIKSTWEEVNEAIESPTTGHPLKGFYN